MRLHLVTADARKVVADVQFVKHFDGLIGGAELALDKATNGGLQSALMALESSRFTNSRIIRLPPASTIGSRNLLVLNLGEIRRFTLGDLGGAISHAIGESLKYGFQTVATPVVGISEEVGLPIERAYRTVLQSLVFVFSDYDNRSSSSSSITDVTIFDIRGEKVEFFSKVTEDILSELQVNFRQFSGKEFDIRVEKSTGSGEFIVGEQTAAPTQIGDCCSRHKWTSSTWTPMVTSKT